jgi:NAD-dependent SIR2 family protein deacetylase
MINHPHPLHEAAKWILEADGLLVTAGAGMGVDSGLPDFRGTDGFWRTYPALGKQGIRFQDIANQAAFSENPRLAWGFYGHRLQLYRDTQPHDGFRILQHLARPMKNGLFVFTSNVDGGFQKAGFPERRISECHGSIHHLQCLEDCTEAIWSADSLQVSVDRESGLLTSTLPTCPHCDALARPNILMFNDASWQSARTDRQRDALERWLANVERPVVIELGAGTAIPSVRRMSERVGAPLLRINPTAPEVSGTNAIGIAGGALTTLKELHACIEQSSASSIFDNE